VRRITVRVLGLTLMAAMLTSAVATQPAVAASGISVKLVKGGMHQPAGFTFGPGGLIYFVERFTGAVKTLNPQTDVTHLVFTIPNVTGSTTDERGGLGIALHPAWPRVPYIYVYATRTVHGHLLNQVLRINAPGGHGTGFRVLMQAGASSAGYHNGGRILFGPGGHLFVFVGDGHVDANAQRHKNPQGKLLRINADGSIPKDNPFKGSRIWTYGNRNSFGYTFDPATGRIWETENGPGCNDEINLIVRGANFGWGANENCSGTSPRDTNNSGPLPRHGPKVFFPSPLGITGDAFCHHCGLPARYEGKLFFGCVNDGRLRVLGLNAARNAVSTGPTALMTVPGGIYSMETAPNGQIYLSNASGIYRLT